MSTLAEKFTTAQEQVKTLTARPSNEELLALYALYKQGTTGDVQGSRPSMFDLKGRAKFDAWTGKKGRSTVHAQQAYVDLVDRLARKG